jgi:hypothetical protein
MASALEIRRLRLGSEHPDTRRSMIAHARLLRALGRSKEARRVDEDREGGVDDAPTQRAAPAW